MSPTSTSFLPKTCAANFTPSSMQLICIAARSSRFADDSARTFYLARSPEPASLFASTPSLEREHGRKEPHDQQRRRRPAGIAEVTRATRALAASGAGRRSARPGISAASAPPVRATARASARASACVATCAAIRTATRSEACATAHATARATAPTNARATTRAATHVPTSRAATRASDCGAARAPRTTAGTCRPSGTRRGARR